MVICEGRATAMLRKHQAAASLAAGVGCISTDTTGSMIPAKERSHCEHSEKNLKLQSSSLRRYKAGVPAKHIWCYFRITQ